MKSAVAIRHLCFEDLGTLGPLLERRGYKLRIYDASLEAFDAAEMETCDLVVVLGAPIGAFDEGVYPFLKEELRVVEQRLRNRRPLLGVCLGAQLMARVLGASVAPIGRKEIGFSPITLTEAGRSSSLAAMPAETPVLHWHGDQFAIPAGLKSLASTPICPHQAFAVDDYALGLQFHLETDTARIESWLVGHASELSQAGVDPRQLRAQAKEHGAKLKTAAEAVFTHWLDRVEDRQP